MTILKIIVAVCLLLVVTNAYTTPARAVDLERLFNPFHYSMEIPKNKDDAIKCHQVLIKGERITEEKHGKMLSELFTHIYEESFWIVVVKANSEKTSTSSLYGASPDYPHPLLQLEGVCARYSVEAAYK